MSRIILSLGANLGDRLTTLRRAVEAFGAPEVKIVRVSSVFETEPVGYLDQGRFLNLAVEAETSLSPRELLKRIRAVEAEFGRVRTIPNGPRTLDIDIIFYGDLVLETPELQIPHPRYRERRFVLEPVAEIAPDWRDPVTGETVRELLTSL